MKHGEQTGPRVRINRLLAGIVVAVAVALAIATVCCGIDVPLGVAPGSDAAADQGGAHAGD